MSYRIHPAIGISRVGNSDDYVIAPETMAGTLMSPGESLTGGLPIRAGTESEVVRSSDLRDATGALKRQAARFRIFQYEDTAEESWPRVDGTEVTIGSKIGGKKVKDIVWTVHVANKKTNWFVLMEDPYQPQGIPSYENGQLPLIRNPVLDAIDPVNAPQPPTDKKIGVLNDPARVRKLTIDAGPRTISGKGSAQVHFDKATVAKYYDTATSKIVELPDYPKSFPADSFPDVVAPAGPIDTLGSLLTDDRGRLLVLGGYGRAVGWKVGGAAPVYDDVNNDHWFDDASDGPVSASIEFDDVSGADVESAWVTATDPAFAPQILNVVSCWDDIYDCWVRNLGLAPQIYDEAKGGYQASYNPTFDDQIAPIFQAAALQQWAVNLSQMGMGAHKQLAAISAQTDPSSTELAGLTIFRNPFKTDPLNPADQNNISLMPLHLGDGADNFLTLRKTQYFFLQRWDAGRGSFKTDGGAKLGPGEYLDKATFVNCLGGRFSPGIDLTFIVREPKLYRQPWRTPGVGPFRVLPATLAYEKASGDKPLLTCGYVPRWAEDAGLEPGDISKFMALPWHTDYNSCATHPLGPPLPLTNPPKKALTRKVFWSWPAQRPVAVYLADDVAYRQDPNTGVVGPILGDQRWSLRGEGTDSPLAENWGRYQFRADILDNWHRIGVVMQGPAIDTTGTPFPADWYLETAGQLRDTGLTPVVPFPNYASQMNATDGSELDPRDLFFQLLNVGDHPGVLDDARLYVQYWLNYAQDFSNKSDSPLDMSFFPYSEEAFDDRLQFVYQELVEQAAASDPGNPDASPLINSRDDMVARIIQMAPFNMTDGAWLRSIGGTGPIDEVRSLLFSVYMDELGDGDVSKNHCNIYRDLCHSVGFYPAPVESREFAFDQRFLDRGFDLPAFQIAISQFTEDYYPEILGMTVYLEWQVVDLKPTRDLLNYYGLNPHFYVMHIGIDNAVNGHGQRAADAVKLYLQNVYEAGGDAAVQSAWRRIWNGYVAFGTVGSFAQDFQDLLGGRKATLEDQMLAMIKRKADFGSRNHQHHMVENGRIDEWFADPPGFLAALRTAGYVIPGDWANSRMKALMDFETGPMFRVFTDDEIALWEQYTESLALPPTPKPPPADSPARAMEAVIKKLRPVQKGTYGHQSNMLADLDGKVHTIAWWFDQPERSFMEALASPVNDVITPGTPEQSRFFAELIAPTGPMGSVFNLPAPAPNAGTCRDVVYTWIKNGCPVTEAVHVSLRLNALQAKRAVHPTGVIHGMGTIH